MTAVKLELPVNTPAADVWSVIGRFDSLAEWHPGVTTCVGGTNDKGQITRTITYANGQVVVERLVKHDDAVRSYTYVVESGRMPVRDLLGQLTVAGNDGQARIFWTADFEPVAGIPAERAVAIIESIVRGPEAKLIERFGAA